MSTNTPRADNLREALIDAMVEVEVSGGMVEFSADHRGEAAYLADAILSDPRLSLSLSASEPDDKHKALWDVIMNAISGTHSAYSIVSAIEASFDIQLRGKITDAEVDAAGRVMCERWDEWGEADETATVLRSLVRDALEAAREARP